MRIKFLLKLTDKLDYFALFNFIFFKHRDLGGERVEPLEVGTHEPIHESTRLSFPLTARVAVHREDVFGVSPVCDADIPEL